MFYQYAIGVVLLVVAVYSAVHALIYKKDSRAAFGWIAVCIFLPLFGPILYFIFGINRVKRRAFGLNVSTTIRNIHDKNTAIDHEISEKIPIQLKNIANVSNHITRLPLVGGNKLCTYYSGEKTYDEMLNAINSAKKFIYLCVYIFKRDKIGKQFIEALTNAKNRGVKIYVLIDGIGELYSFRKVRRKLLKHDIKVLRFLPPRLIPLNFSINLRNHRKILVIDGEISFIGGMNISQDYYLNDGKAMSSLKDIHFRVTGPIVNQLQNVFESDWQFAGGKINNNLNNVAVNSSTSIVCRTVLDGPGENLDHLSIILLSAINSAKNSIILMTPYFLPSREIIAALQIASFRGVNTIIILPERSNLSYVHWATRHMLWELLEQGVNVFYQPGPFSHSKLFVIDKLYSLIGSANIDPRSLRLNYEVGLEVYDAEFATELSNYAQNILQSCRNVTLEEVDNRAITIKVRDGIAWLFSPYL